MNVFQQENFKINLVGEVTVPDLGDIAGRLAVAAGMKTSITLTAGEARILVDKLLEE